MGTLRWLWSVPWYYRFITLVALSKLGLDEIERGTTAYWVVGLTGFVFMLWVLAPPLLWLGSLPVRLTRLILHRGHDP